MSRKLAYALIIIILIGTMAWGLVTFNNLLQTRSELDQLHREIATLEMNLEIANNSLAQAQAYLTSAQQELSSVESELELYKDTYGSVVSSDVQPPYRGADIVNNETASNPTWARLLDFLRNDRTDENAYWPGVYMCGDFAKDLHNDAERAGIRAAYVAIEVGGANHALNAFKTTDRGLVFIDCTGLVAWEPGPSNCDKIVDVRLGKRYVPKSLFPESGWSVTWESLGIVHDVEIYW
jgi:exonuclease VII small subunit